MSPAVRVAALPPAPVPYREPLWAGLAERGALELRVIHQAARGTGWGMREDWYAAEHPYDAIHLHARQLARRGGTGTPIVWSSGLERALRAFDPAVVVAWEYGPSALRAARWCRRHDRPLVIFSELTPAAAATLPGWQQRLHGRLAQRAAGFIGASSQACDRFVELGADPARVEVSLQSADLEPFRAAATERAAREDGPVRFLSVGRLVGPKNHATLIEAWAAARLDPAAAELELVGAGPLEDDLRALAARLGVPARFSGELQPVELPAAHAQADVFVLASTLEPFGVAVREAVAAGLPVICTRTAGAAGDVAVEGRNALLFDPTSVTALALALQRLAGDGAERARLAAGSGAVDAETGIGRSVEGFERAVLRATGSEGPNGGR